jgi:selenocysteine-specific elongation factor
VKGTEGSGVIVGTAGHVDHGKTELIKALTGVDTDRLAEEKRRGLTIDLGFAPLDLPQYGRVGIVDVPGHQRFLKNMLAGVGGIDVALLVVAADEGVMPQTLEHFEILRLLGVPKLLAVVSKADMVEEELADLVVEEVQNLLGETYLAGSPVLKVSALAKTGLKELILELDKIVAEIPPRRLDHPPRLPIDRVFVLQGIGTVVTGSLTHGVISQGDEVVVYPQKLKSRIRQIQVHNELMPRVAAGHRVALNLAGPGKSELQRGEVISVGGAFHPAQQLDIKLKIVGQDLVVKDWARVRLSLGSAEVLARLVILSEKEAKSGQEVYGQLRLEAPTVAWYGDRFVLRAYSPQTLLGGGVVLNPFPPKHRRFDNRVLRSLEARDGGDPSQILLMELAQGPMNIVNVRDNLGLSEERLKAVVQQLEQKGHLSVLGRYLVGSEGLEKIKGEILSLLEDFHRRYPLQIGMSKEELKGKIHYPPQLVEETLSALEEVEVLGDQVRQKGRRVRFTQEQQREQEKIEALFLERKFSPPTKDEVLAEFDSKVFYALAKQGVLVGLTKEIYLHRSALEEAKSLIKRELTHRGQMRLSEMREIWGTTRKFAVPLAEYLDRLGFTHRVGDMRMLSERP